MGKAGPQFELPNTLNISNISKCFHVLTWHFCRKISLKVSCFKNLDFFSKAQRRIVFYKHCFSCCGLHTFLHNNLAIKEPFIFFPTLEK